MYTLIKQMKKLIEKLEGAPIGIVPWITTFFAIVIIRMIFESFSGNGLALYQVRDVFLEPPLYYLATLFSIAIFLKLMTKVEMRKILNLVVFGFLAFPAGPILDYIISGGSGNFQQHYLFDTLPQLVRDYFTFFGPTLTNGATYGIRLQAAFGLLGAGAYIYLKTRSWRKTVVGFIGGYTIGFFYGCMPAIAAILMNLPKNPWDVSQIEMLKKVLIPRNIFALRFGPNDIWHLLNIEVSLILIPLVFVLGLCVFYLWDKNKFLALIKNLRYLRLVLHYIAVVAGVGLGITLYKSSIDSSFFGIMALIDTFIVTSCVWIFSLTTNDRNDIEIDKISNQSRLLVKNIFEPREFTALAIISFVFAIIASFALGYNFSLLTLGNFVLAYLYSYEPLRLRRFPLVAPLMMSLGISFLVLFGFLLFSPSGTFVDFPTAVLVLIVFSMALIINVKDVKDIEGDSKNGIYTIPTLFGDKRGKIIISLLFLISYLLFPIILHEKQLILTAIIFSTFTWFLINTKKVHEWYVFSIYILFLAITHVVTH